jgi:DNA-directed RNA polymerase subunit RPC12/RpoP
MDFFCYQHPDRIAVAKIERPIQQHTPEGEKRVTIVSPVCQECADGARAVRTPLLQLRHNPQEVLQFIKENDLDACPECGNREGNHIVLPTENETEEDGGITCAECGLGWWPVTEGDLDP